MTDAASKAFFHFLARNESLKHMASRDGMASPTSFARRFNRRHQLYTLTEPLAYACARTAPHPYRVIIAG